MKRFLAMGLLLFGGLAEADVPNAALVCPPDEPVQDAYSHFRALSLDLRGVVPTMSEMESLQASGEVTEDMVDLLLESDGFAERVVRRHRDLLWNNVTNINLLNATASFRRENLGGGNYLYWVRNRGTMYRGGFVPCLDTPVTYTADGTIEVTQGVDPNTGAVVYQEGYRWVNPYWAPETPIKVCAFDAQEADVSPSGTSCGERDGLTDPGCGCGANVRYCRYGNLSQRPILEAMAGDVERRIAAVIQQNLPYTDLFTSKRAYVNGPLVHFLRYQTPFYANVRFVPQPLDVSTLPALTYADQDTWVEIELPDMHAGVLTSWAFLLRFQTNRARANRFYNNFLCQPFQPPQGGIPFASEEETSEPDLQVRAGCKYCHALLEPAASYWGRWTESGAGFLDATDYPEFDEVCFTCAMTGQGCSAACNTYYLVNQLAPEQGPYMGWLNAYEFRRPEHMTHPDVGPRVLALTAVVDHRLPTCVAYQTASWLLGRELWAEEVDWVEELAVDFVSNDYNYRDLIQAIVQSPTYRRVR